tara:strand:- start:25 stop:987 length:963 start_codon:yes stop_codon:yes gene_type:complete
MDLLDKLLRHGVTNHHIECLRKFALLQGELITDSRRLRGERGGRKIPADETVSNPYYLHNLVRGVYKPQSDPFALSIQTNPQSKWGKEIDDPEAGQWKINYDFEDEKKYHADMASLEICFQKKIPIGVIYKKKKAHNQILGLGTIKKIEGTLFEIIPYDGLNLKDLEVNAYNEIKKQYEKNNYSSSGSKRTIMGRMNTKYFKEQLQIQYDGKCATCGFGLIKYLRGAHIVPFSEMQKWDPKNSMNPSNGLLLCSTCDIAFEIGDLRITPNFKVKKSKKLQENENQVVNDWLKNVKDELSIKKSSMFPPNEKFLKKKISML